MTTKAALVWCPFPDKETAREVSARLLEMKLIACANILGPMEAMFEWAGQVNSGNEVPVLFKTDSLSLEQLVSQLGAMHPYDTPTILGWHCDTAHPSTLAWLGGLNLGAAE